MLFNSTVFVQFFAAFLFLYWLLRHRLQARNILIVAASYLFYGWWDYRFLSLLVASSVIDYFVALGLAGPDSRRRQALLIISVTANLTLLGFFKYYDFFITSFAEMLQQLNLSAHPRTLNIILPIGISFYTFQTMSYTIDVYRREIPPTRSLFNFLAYVSFFPQLVAGPIERARHLLPQFERTLSITLPMIEQGLWLCLWGFFKKVVIADNLAPLVDMVYGADPFTGTGSAVVVGTIAFAFQIYCDFSGYSDIARGLARILGFELMVNFDRPYFSTSIREFWRRWHISLSTWLRDYLYISLGGNRRGEARTYVNLILTMLLGGLWHGAAWNFVLWGLWHGVGLAAHRWLTHNAKPSAQRSFASLMIGWAVTTLFVLYGWLLFRAKSMDHIQALTMALGNFQPPPWLGSYLVNLAVFVTPLLVVEFLLGWRPEKVEILSSRWWVRMIAQGCLLFAIVIFWEKRHVPFVYFQF